MDYSINQRFMKVLEEKSISQVEYAKKIGTSRATISNWSTHKSAVPLDRIIELLHFFPDVDIEWLLTGRERYVENAASVMENESIVYTENITDKDYIIKLQKDIISLQQRELARYKQQTFVTKKKS